MNPKKQKASVLVFALIVLFIGIAAAIGIAGSTVISQKNSITTASSTQSFQVADSGTEIMLQKIKSFQGDSSKTLVDLGCINGSGTVSGNIGSADKAYLINFHKTTDPDNTFTTDCATKLTDIDRIKSVGSYKNTNRAVSVAVAAGGGGCYVSYKSTCPSGADCCLTGFAKEGSAGDWGLCTFSSAWSMFSPAGGNCPNTFNKFGEAVVCCK